MKPGPLIRKLFGPQESRIAEMYRRMYIDLDDSVWPATLVPEDLRIIRWMLTRSRRSRAGHQTLSDDSTRVMPPLRFANARIRRIARDDDDAMRSAFL